VNRPGACGFVCNPHPQVLGAGLDPGQAGTVGCRVIPFGNTTSTGVGPCQDVTQDSPRLPPGIICSHHNCNITPPPSSCRLLEAINELTKLVSWLVPCDDLLGVNVMWFVSCLLSTVDVPFDTSDAECMTALEGLCILHDHGVLTATIAGVHFNDVHE